MTKRKKKKETDTHNFELSNLFVDLVELLTEILKLELT